MSQNSLKEVETNICRTPQQIWMLRPICIRLRIIHPQDRMLKYYEILGFTIWLILKIYCKESHGLSSVLIPVRMSMKLWLNPEL